MKIFHRLIFIGFLILAGMSQAQETFPNKPVTMIVAFPAGGGTDIVARRVGQALGDMWKQSVIIDNKGGAAGTIGTLAAMKAPADGYNLLMGTMGNLTVNQHLYSMEINPLKGLTAITNVVGVNFVLIANPSFPANNIKELIALGKQKPDFYNYSSSGAGGAPHLAVELFKSMSGAQFKHIPYKGSGPSLNDLMAGHVNFSMDSIVQSLPLIQAGKLKAIAVLGSKRSPLLPNVPTIAESGLPDYEFTNWFGIVVPSQTNKDIVNKLYGDITKVLTQPDMRSQLEKMGAEVINNSPSEFAQQMQNDSNKWAKIIKDAKITAE